MEDWYIYSGVANSGQNRLWQHRFRQEFAIPNIQNNPPLYTPLNYLEGTGTQKINTEIPQANVGRIILRVRMTSLNNQNIYGNYYVGVPLSLGISQQGTWQAYYNGWTVSNTSAQLNKDAVIEYQFNSNNTQSFIVDGQTILSTTKATYSQATGNIAYLFDHNAGTGTPMRRKNLFSKNLFRQYTSRRFYTCSRRKRHTLYDE